MKSCAVVTATLAAVCALTFSEPSFATTQPTKFVAVSVVISDSGIKLGVYNITRTHEGSVAAPDIIPRGDYVGFTVVNVGKKRHNFTILGHKTVALKHGQKTHFSVAAMIRGAFPYASTLDKGKPFRGYLSVA